MRASYFALKNASTDHAVCVVDAAGSAVARFTERGDGPVVNALLDAGMTLAVITVITVITGGSRG